MNGPDEDDPILDPYRAARPRWVLPKGTFSDEGARSVLQAIPMPGVEPDALTSDPVYLVGGPGQPVLQRVPSRSPVCTCGAARHPGIDTQELERANAGLLHLVFRAADAFGRGLETSLEGAGRPVRSQSSGARPQYAFHEAFETPLDRWDFLVGRHEATGEAYHVWLRGFDFTHGNVHFFEPDDTARIRLRPLIGTDRMNPRRALCTSTGWFGGDVNSLLWVDRPEGDGTTAFLVRLFPRKDCRDPATIARAIDQARREYGADFPAAVALLS